MNKDTKPIHSIELDNIRPTTDASSNDAPKSTSLEDHSSRGNAEQSAAPRTDEADAIVKLNAKQLAFMSIALALAIFLIALDETIIATAIPRITNQFHSLNDVGWYGSAYMLTMCCFQLHYGKLYQQFNAKRVFLAAICLFEIGSALCGASPNSASLIVGRAIAGSGASGIVSGVLIIIAKAVPIRQRSIYNGAVGSIYGVASLAGPLLGGVITDSRLTWRWCFYVNLPVGACVVLVISLLYRPPKQPKEHNSNALDKLKTLDPIGFILFVPAVVCLLLALQLSGSQDSWGDARVIALLVLCSVFTASFVASQIWLKEAATVPPRLIRQRTVAFAAVFAMCLDGAYYILSYYLPIWFQAIQGISAAESGIHNIPLIIGAFSMALLSGALVTAFGHYLPFIVCATMLTSIGCGLLTTLDIHAGPAKWIGYQAVAGMGVGLGMQQAALAAQNVLSPEDMPIGISVVTFFQTLGPAITVSVASNVLDQRLSAGLKTDVPGVNIHTLLDVGATNITKVVQPSFVPVALVDINKALSQTFYVAVAVAVASGVGALGMEWKTMKKDEDRGTESSTHKS